MTTHQPLCAATRCASRGKHLPDCGEETCWGCLARQAADGLYLCLVHTDSIGKDALTTALRYGDLGRVLTGSSQALGDHVSGTKTAVGLDLNERAAEMRAVIKHRLVAIVRMIAEERGLSFPEDRVPALARETVTAQHGPEVKPPAHCIAHGEPGCDLCSLNPADCAEPSGSCDEYRVDGMHFDECPNRITTYKDAVKRLHRIDGGPQFGIVYKFGREGDPCPECKGFNGKHNSVFDEHDWGTDCRRCSYDPAGPVRD